MQKRTVIQILRIFTALMWFINLLGAPTSSVLAGAGDLDGSFSGGYVTTDATPNSDSIKRVAVLPDGKIIAAGTSLNSDYSEAISVLARYTSDGALDTSFGSSGIVTFSYGAGWTALMDLAIMPDGRIVTAGMFMTPGGASRVFMLSRFCPDGLPDTGANCPELTPKFGTDGKVLTQLAGGGNQSYAQAVTLQSDGKIVAGGLAGGTGGQHQFALARYNSDGSLDASFDGDGMVVTNVGGYVSNSAQDEIYDLAIDSNGRIVAAGFSYNEGLGINQFALVRYDTDGSLDSTFNGSGIVLTTVGEYSQGNAVAVQPGDDKIIVGGWGDIDAANYVRGFAVARYNPDGSLDLGFGSGGTALFTFDPAIQYDFGNTLILDGEGRILIGGNTYDATYTTEIMALARLCPDGTLDNGSRCSTGGFGGDGLVTQAIGTSSSIINALAIRPSDGKIIAAGRSQNGGDNLFTLALFDGGTDNLAPGLDASKTPNLSPTNQSQSSAPLPGSTAGSLPVAQLIDSGGSLNNFSDPDGDPAGSAITGLGGGGTWWYTINGGTNWNAAGSVSASSALLLAADGNTRLFYQNTGGFKGTIDPAVTFRAWDGTMGTAGAKVNPGAGGGSTAFSANTDSAPLIVVDDVAPSVTSVNIPANQVYKAGQTLSFTVNFSENVEVDTSGGTPRLVVTLNSGTVYAAYTSGNHSSALTFSYTILEGDSDPDGIQVGAALDANGGTLHDTVGNSAILALNSIPGTGGIRVDTLAPPAPTLVTPANSSTTNNSTPAVTGTAEVGSTITIYLDGTAVGTTTADGAGNWSYTPASALSEGSHNVRATSTDAAGNMSVSSNTNSFTIDTLPPTAPVVVIPANGSSTKDTTPDITGTGEANSTLTVYVNGTAVGTTTSDGTGSWTYFLGSPMSEGTYNLKATSTDVAGNVSVFSNTNTFTIDTQAPAAPVVVAPANGSHTNDNTPVISGTAEAGSTVAVSIDGAPVGTTTTNGAGSWIFTPGSPLAEGSHTVRATSTDPAGNSSSFSNTNSFTVDTLAPASPVVVSPGNGSRTNDSTPAISGTAEANTTVSVYLDGALSGTTTANGAGSWNYTPAAPLSEGAHSVKAGSADTAGNESSFSSTNTFTVDTQPPSVDSIQRASTNPTIAATVDYLVHFSEAVTGLQLANFSLNTSGISGASLSGMSSSGDTYTITVSTGSGSGTLRLDLANGTGVTDLAGNSLTGAPVSGQTYTLDRNTSVALSASPQPSVYGQAVQLTATVASSLGIPTGRVDFFDQGQPFGHADLDNTGVASYEMSLLSTGDHSFSASYNGDATFSESESDPLDHTVQKAAPTIQLSSNANPSIYGQALTFTVQLSKGSLIPNGSISLRVDGSSKGTQAATGGTASFSVSGLGAGSHTIDIEYSGDTNFLNATASLTQVVNKATASLSLQNLTQTYDGTPRPVSASVTPAGISVAITYNGSTTVPTQAGSYTVRAEVTDPNYTGLVEETLTIAKAQLKVITDNQVRRAGQPNPILTGHYNGFVNHEDSSVLSGAPAFSTTADQNSPAGLYPIQVGAGTLAAANYRFVFYNAILTVHTPPVVASPVADITTQAGKPFIFTLPVGTFTDADPGDGLSYTACQAGGSSLPGWLIFSPVSRSFTGTPAQPGELTIQVRAEDAWGDAVQDEFKLSVEAQPVINPNRPPAVTEDQVSASTGASVSINLLDNDSDPDGDTLRLQSVSTPTHGSLTFESGGNLVFTPEIHFTGQETVIYIVTDGHGGTGIGRVTISSSALEEESIGIEDSAVTLEDQAVVVPVLYNDLMADGSEGEISGIQQQPQHGSVVINPDGTVTYTPDSGFTGSDSFTYLLIESGSSNQRSGIMGLAAGKTSEITVTVIVGSVDGEAAASDDQATTDENSPVMIDPLANDTTTLGSKQLLGVVNQPEHGQVVIQAGGKLLYTPDRYFSGVDHFTYSMGNGLHGYAAAEVMITVRDLDQAPQAVNDEVETIAGFAVTIDVLANDSDVEDVKPLLLNVSSGDHGSTEIIDGKVTYTPTAGFQGVDQFLYTIKDSAGGVNFGAVMVKVTAPAQSTLYIPIFIAP